MKKEDLIKEWKRAESQTFKGWDFSYINDRIEIEDMSWEYKDIVLKYLKNTDELLDMGTGDGVFLEKLSHSHNLTSVTEGYEPNYILCKETLEPKGIKVKKVLEDDIIDFKDNSFDIVINRHESFDVNEVKRVLKNNGYFITQQVGGNNNHDFKEIINGNAEQEFSGHDLENNIKLLEKAGFEIEFNKEEYLLCKYKDVSTFVYYAKIIPWEFPNFSVKSHADKLFKLQKQLLKTGYIEAKEHRFIIVCKNIKSGK